MAAQFGHFDAPNTILDVCQDVDFDIADKDGRTICTMQPPVDIDDIVLSVDNREEADPESDDEDTDDGSDEGQKENKDENSNGGHDEDEDESSGNERMI